ncbi:MAG: glutathione S-transferase family protein [Myxococcota bacterium]
MYVLHGAPGSGAAIIEFALAELGLGYRYMLVSLRDEAQRDEAYAELNPHRKVPTLITPDGETLTESAAILLTLEERHPGSELLPPAGSQERAQALRLLLFAATELYPIIEIVDYPERFGPEAVKEAIKARALETWRGRWLLVESKLESGPFLFGDQLSIVDLYLAVLSRWDLRPEDREALPRVVALSRAVAERPALRELWLRNFPAK